MTSPLLPGQSPPLTVITPTNQSGVILIVTSLALAIALVSFLIRVYLQILVRQHFALDNIFAAVSIIIGVLQSATVFIAVSKGFGKTIADISPHKLILLQKATYSSDLLFVITLWLTKCSVAFMFLRLSPFKGHNIFSYTIFGSSTVFMIVSVFALAFRCEVTAPWIFINARCSNLLLRWEVETVFDTITEIAIFFASIHLVRGLQLPLSKKLTVILAFGLRLPVIVPALVRLVYLNQEFKSSDPTLHGVLASVCTQIQMNYAIVATTIPCLRPFISALNTSYGAPADVRTIQSSSRAKYKKEFELSSLSKGSSLGFGRLEKSKASKASTTPRTPWDLTNNAIVVPGDQHSMESHESRRMIISRTNEWHVDYEGAGKKTPES